MVGMYVEDSEAKKNLDLKNMASKHVETLFFQKRGLS